MRIVYASQFRVRPKAGESGDAVVTDLKERLARWVKNGYRRNWGQAVDVDFAGEPLKPASDHRIATTERQDGGRDLVSLRWSHPGSDDSSLIWTTECVVAREADAVELSVAVKLSSRRFQLAPIPAYSVGRPRFITEILREWTCLIGEERVPTEVETVGVGEVEDFVHSVLESDDRRLPVILLSRDAWSDQPFTDPNALLRRVLGLARVVVIDKYAGFDLTGVLGKRLSCYNGAIRVYWPGFASTNDPRRHPLFLPDRMRAHAQRGRPIDEHLFRRLSELAVLRGAEGEILSRVRSHYEALRSKQLGELRQALKEKEARREQLDELELRLLQALEENDELRERNHRLSEELEAARTNLQNVLSSWHERDEAADYDLDAADLGPSPDVESVPEALAKAEEAFGDRLLIWDSAREAATEAADFARPEEVYEALEAIVDLATLYFESLEEGESIGPWENFFAARGIDYKPGESELTRNKYGRHRTFKHEGRQLRIFKHITIGGGSRINCVQIYFDADPDERVMNIAYCGRHLPYATQRT